MIKVELTAEVCHAYPIGSNNKMWIARIPYGDYSSYCSISDTREKAIEQLKDSINDEIDRREKTNANRLADKYAEIVPFIFEFEFKVGQTIKIRFLKTSKITSDLKKLKGKTACIKKIYSNDIIVDVNGKEYVLNQNDLNVNIDEINEEQ